MQTKKRAKSVKFGEKDKKKPPIEKSEKKVSDDTKHDENIEVETHFSAVVEELDIVEKTEPEDEPKEQSQTKSEVELAPEPENDVEKKVESEDVDTSEGGDFFSAPPDQYDNKKSMVPYFVIVTIVTFLLGLTFFAGIYYAVKNKSINFSFPATKKVEITKTPTVSPTEKPVDLSLYSIKVLNGTDVPGTAAKVKTELTDAGFKVESIGNAEKTDFTKTEIAALKKVDKKYLEKLKEILGKSYIIGKPSTVATAEADVIVTIGSSSAK